jgi:hypothetical protein
MPSALFAFPDSDSRWLGVFGVELNPRRLEGREGRSGRCMLLARWDSTSESGSESVSASPRSGMCSRLVVDLRLASILFNLEMTCRWWFVVKIGLRTGCQDQN